jgi:hypothetical protein
LNGLGMENAGIPKLWPLGIFYLHWVCCLAIWYRYFWSFGIYCYRFGMLYKENLATLLPTEMWLFQ